LDQLTDGQVLLDELGWNETLPCHTLYIRIRPNAGPYVGGQYRFQICLGPTFPQCAPEVACLDVIFHPNIDPTETENNVCLSTLDEWTPSCSLDDVIQGLLFLFHNPNLDDPLSPYVTVGMDEDEFVECVRKTMEGMLLDGCRYGRTVIIDEASPPTTLTTALTTTTTVT